jgi:hypothetical protein
VMNKMNAPCGWWWRWLLPKLHHDLRLIRNSIAAMIWYCKKRMKCQHAKSYEKVGQTGQLFHAYRGFERRLFRFGDKVEAGLIRVVLSEGG